MQETKEQLLNIMPKHNSNKISIPQIKIFCIIKYELLEPTHKIYLPFNRISYIISNYRQPIWSFQVLAFSLEPLQMLEKSLKFHLIFDREPLNRTYWLQLSENGLYPATIFIGPFLVRFSCQLFLLLRFYSLPLQCLYKFM